MRCGFLFRAVIPQFGVRSYVLLSRPPLVKTEGADLLDLHVLGTPPAFILSQDQTLQKNLYPQFSQKLTLLFKT